MTIKASFHTNLFDPCIYRDFCVSYPYFFQDGNIKGIALLNTNYKATTLESMQNYCKDYYIISRFMYVL